jgi:CRISPR system Cascade subunit CasD
MATLLLRLAGPLQAWGCDSKFETRRTGKEPSKSGVIGLLAAALGRRRDASLDDLARLRFGVRVDHEGELLRDFHTARSVKQNYVTYRYYLADATFVVGLESDDEKFLEQLRQALLHPAFPLFLGRRSCVPVLPLVLGIREVDLVSSLREEPWQISAWRQERLFQKAKYAHKQNISLSLLVDADVDDVNVKLQRDLPLSFNPQKRSYGIRAFKLLRPVLLKVPSDDTTHDAMSEL